jgi:hypothetical protein
MLLTLCLVTFFYKLVKAALNLLTLQMCQLLILKKTTALYVLTAGRPERRPLKCLTTILVSSFGFSDISKLFPFGMESAADSRKLFWHGLKQDSPD